MDRPDIRGIHARRGALGLLVVPSNEDEPNTEVFRKGDIITRVHGRRIHGVTDLWEEGIRCSWRDLWWVQLVRDEQTTMVEAGWSHFSGWFRMPL